MDFKNLRRQNYDKLIIENSFVIYLISK